MKLTFETGRQRNYAESPPDASNPLEASGSSSNGNGNGNQPQGKMPPTGSLGLSGTIAMGNRIFEDYKRELSGRDAVEIYERMRRSDAEVNMTLRAIKTPIQQAQWKITPSANDPEMGEEIAEFVRRIMFSGEYFSWKNALYEALLMLDFGYSIEEIVWQRVPKPDHLSSFRSSRNAKAASSDKVVGGTVEVPFKLGNDIIILAGLPLRHPRTIYYWKGLSEKESNYELHTVTQYIKQLGRWIDIPVDRLCIFTNNPEGQNYEGRSLLRTSYKHWLIKENLEKIDAIGHEREAVGIPHVHIEDVSLIQDLDKTIADYETLLSNLQAQERNYVITMPGATFEVIQTQRQNRGIIDSINYHGRMIGVNMIGQFLELGGSRSGSGSRATAAEQRGPFDLSLLSIADEVGSKYQQRIIRPLVEYNYGPRPGYPVLEATGILDENMQELAVVLKNLTDAGLIIPDKDLEDWLRGTLKLPPAGRTPNKALVSPRDIQNVLPTLARSGDVSSNLNIDPWLKAGLRLTGGADPETTDYLAGSEEAPDKPEPPPLPPGGATPPAAAGAEVPPPPFGAKGQSGTLTANDQIKEEPKTPVHAHAEVGGFWRERRPSEQYVAFEQIDATLRGARSEFVDSIRPTVQEMADSFISDLAVAVAARDFTAIANTRAPKVGKLASKIKSELPAAVAFGRQTIRDERDRGLRGTPASRVIDERHRGIKTYATRPPVPGRPQPIYDTEEIQGYETAKASQTAQDVANKMELGLCAEAFRMARKNISVGDAIAALGSVAVGIIDRLAQSASNVLQSLFNIGRGAEVQDQMQAGVPVDGAEYSALLDDNVCEVCSPLDGQTYTPEDPEFEEYANGNPDCEGGENCRCMLFYHYSDMAQPTDLAA